MFWFDRVSWFWELVFWFMQVQGSGGLLQAGYGLTYAGFRLLVFFGLRSGQVVCSFVYLFFVLQFLWFLSWYCVITVVLYFSSCLKPKPAKPALLFLFFLSLQYSFSIKKCLCFVLLLKGQHWEMMKMKSLLAY